MIYTEEIRYPEKGDLLIADGGDKEELAWVQNVFKDFGGYGDHYQAATMTLLDRMQKEPKTKDELVFPAIFTIRHYVELRLKELVQGLTFCIKNTIPKPSKGHDLIPLYDKFCHCIRALGRIHLMKYLDILET